VTKSVPTTCYCVEHFADHAAHTGSAAFGELIAGRFATLIEKVR
jgi:hypothetical protein